MDKTKEYKEMCRKAVEVQEYWHNSPHTITEWARSYFVSPKDDSLIHYYDFESYPQHSTGYTWLPRQDQLQDMVETNINYLMSRFTTCMVSFQDEYIEQFRSMEQLWLAFVMHEKFSKVWRDGEWIMK